MLSVAMVLFYQRLGENWASRRRLLTAADFASVLAHFPESVMPARRKRRQYISSILSKNEVSRQDPYNRKLFARAQHGQYLFNPSLALRVEGEWRRVYDLLVPERLAGELVDPERWGSYVWDPNSHRQQGILTLREKLGELRADKTVAQAFRSPFDKDFEDQEASSAKSSVAEGPTGEAEPDCPRSHPAPRAEQLSIDLDD